MSTKIYNAYIFDGTINELINILKNIREEYEEHAKKTLLGLSYFHVNFTKKRYPFLESDMTMKELKESSFGEFTLEDIIIKEKSRNEHHPFNIDASSVVYFFEDKLYVQLFGLPRDFQKDIINKYTQFRDYHFQNSTDQSNYDWEKESWSKMSDERQKELEDEWDERDRVWENILPGWSAPSDHGLIFEFTPTRLSMFCSDVLREVDL